MKMFALTTLTLVAAYLLTLGGYAHHCGDLAIAAKPVIYSGAIILVCVVWLVLI